MSFGIENVIRFSMNTFGIGNTMLDYIVNSTWCWQFASTYESESTG